MSELTAAEIVKLCAACEKWPGSTQVNSRRRLRDWLLGDDDGIARARSYATLQAENQELREALEIADKGITRYFNSTLSGKAKLEGLGTARDAARAILEKRKPTEVEEGGPNDD